MINKLRSITHPRSLLAVAATAMAFSVGAAAQTKVIGLEVSIGETTVDQVDYRYEIYDDSDYELTGDTSRVIPGNEIALDQAKAARVFFNDQGRVRGAVLMLDAEQKSAVLDALKNRYSKAPSSIRTPLITYEEKHVFLDGKVQIAMGGNSASPRFVLLYRNTEFIRDSAKAAKEKRQAAEQQ